LIDFLYLRNISKKEEILKDVSEFTETVKQEADTKIAKLLLKASLTNLTVKNSILTLLTTKILRKTGEIFSVPLRATPQLLLWPIQSQRRKRTFNLQKRGRRKAPQLQLLKSRRREDPHS
jgi:hypothetical protein